MTPADAMRADKLLQALDDSYLAVRAGIRTGNTHTTLGGLSGLIINAQLLGDALHLPVLENTELFCANAKASYSH
jgi:hypothetical protein